MALTNIIGVQHDVLRHSGLDPESPERRAGRGRTEIP